MRKKASPPPPLPRHQKLGLQASSVPTAECSRPLVVARIGSEPLRQGIEANQGERAALAVRFAIPGIKRLVAEVEVAREPDGKSFSVDGRLNAEVTQECVVSLEPFDCRVEASFHREFTERLRREELEEIDPESDDPPDQIVDGTIDIGEVVAEELALALDPYPRRPEARLPDQVIGSPDGEKAAGADRPNPFAVLAALKEKKGG